MRFAAIALILGMSLSAQDGSVYGGPGETRYSSLKQISRNNVSRLRVAWTYDTADGANAPKTQPIVVNRVLYGLNAHAQGYRA